MLFQIMHKRTLHRAVFSLAAVLLCLTGIFGFSVCAAAYDAGKLESEGLIRGDLSTWTQREDSFPENLEVCVNGRSPLASMGCSYYATFFMLCKAGVMDPLKDTAWEFALDCYNRGLSRPNTGYFDPRSVSEMTDGRVTFVESGNFESYYNGQSAIASCRNTDDVRNLLRSLTQDNGWFCVACCVGNVTNFKGEEYYSEGHYIFIDEVLEDDMIIGDSAFDGKKWSQNWGAHNSRIVKIYCYEAWDEKGNKILPSDCDSMYRIRREIKTAGKPAGRKIHKPSFQSTK